jgi:hypothetical protein
MVSMKATARGFTAIAVPPTLTWSSDLAEDRAQIRGLGAAIEANPYISSARKEFLIRRLTYWNEWSARNKGRAVLHTGQEE